MGIADHNIKVYEAIERVEALMYTDDEPAIPYRDLALLISKLRDLQRQVNDAYVASVVVIDLLEGQYPALIQAFQQEVKEREHFWRWRNDFIHAVIERAALIAKQHSQFDNERAVCPLCGGTPLTAYVGHYGFALPEGLHRHLDSYGNRGCRVMEVLAMVNRRQWRE